MQITKVPSSLINSFFLLNYLAAKDIDWIVRKNNTLEDTQIILRKQMLFIINMILETLGML